MVWTDKYGLLLETKIVLGDYVLPCSQISENIKSYLLATHTVPKKKKIKPEMERWNAVDENGRRSWMLEDYLRGASPQSEYALDVDVVLSLAFSILL